MQTGSVEAYTNAFCMELLDSTNINDSEAVHYYVSGLKTEPRNWGYMMTGNKMPTLQHAAKIAEWYDNTHTITIVN